MPSGDDVWPVVLEANSIMVVAAMFAAAFGFWVGVAFFAIEGALILALAILAGRGG